MRLRSSDMQNKVENALVTGHGSAEVAASLLEHTHLRTHTLNQLDGQMMAPQLADVSQATH